MRTLNHYIGRSFASSFLMTVGILIFVMSLAGLFRITDLLVRQAPVGLIGLFFLWSLPALLVYAIPVGALTGTLMVCGRLSGEGELTAMKACGISVWQAGRSLFFAGALLTALCLFVNFEVAPRIERRQRALMEQMGQSILLSLLPEGQFQPMGSGVSVYVYRKKDRRLLDVVLVEQSGTFTRRIEAKEAFVSVSPDAAFFEFDLRNVKVSPLVEGKDGSGFIERMPFVLPIQTKDRLRRGEEPMNGCHLGIHERNLRTPSSADRPAPGDPALAKGAETAFPLAGVPARAYRRDRPSGLKDAVRKTKRGLDPRNLATGELIVEMTRVDPETGPMPEPGDHIRIKVEFGVRLVMSLACMAFVVIGIPLGIRNPRRESSGRIGLSMLLAFVFYIVVIQSVTLARIPIKHPDFFARFPVLLPHIFVWFPVVAYIIVGIWLIRRSN